MLGIVGIADQVVKATLGLPSSLRILFFLQFLLVLIDQGESQREEVLRVAVEVLVIISYLFAELLLLELPNVQLLISIHEDFDTLRDGHTRLGWPSLRQRLQ